MTTSNPDAALNFGMDEQMEHAERYRPRPRVLRCRHRPVGFSGPTTPSSATSRAASISIPAKLHVLDHKGKYLKVRGPLNIARPIQGWPVMVQAGASDAGRQLAAETAEVVFAAGGPIEAGRAFYADVKGRAAKIGRNPDHIKILPGAFTIVGDSLDEAKEKRARLDSLVSYDSGIAALSIAIGHDARKFDPDGPLPEIPETNQSKSGRERVVALAKREELTVRQLAGRLGGYGGLAMMGTPEDDRRPDGGMAETDACDGFNVMFPYLPGGLDDFVDKVVPELQRRGLFRTEYEGRTLRENLGLPRPGEPLLRGGREGGGVASKPRLSLRLLSVVTERSRRDLSRLLHCMNGSLHCACATLGPGVGTTGPAADPTCAARGAGRTATTARSMALAIAA